MRARMPEGLTVAFPLVREKYSRFRALYYVTLTGLAKPLGGLLGVAMVSLSRPPLSWELNFAAGAMILARALRDDSRESSKGI
jgi:ZIP family zinc transporter